MPGSIWEWLDIEPTTDKALIKKAYAEQSRKYHPEDCPREAGLLREAYKQAMALASADRSSLNSQGMDALPGFFPREEPGDKVSPEDRVSPENRVSLEGKISKEDPSEFVFRMEPEQKSDKEQEQEPKAQFHYSQGKGQQVLSDSGGQPPFPEDMNFHYEYKSHNFEPRKAERIKKLAEQLIFVHERPEYRWIPKIWEMVLVNYPEPEDFRDPGVISELLNLMEQMPYLDKPVVRTLKTAFFFYAKEDAAWKHLEDRMEEIRRSLDRNRILQTRKRDLIVLQDSARMEQPLRFPIGQMRSKAAKELYGKRHRIYRRTVFHRIAFNMIVLILVIGALYIVSWSVKQRVEEERRQQEILDRWEQEVIIKDPEIQEWLKQEYQKSIELHLSPPSECEINTCADERGQE